MPMANDSDNAYFDGVEQKSSFEYKWEAKLQYDKERLDEIYMANRMLKAGEGGKAPPGGTENDQTSHRI